jgi:MFS family permease
VLRGPARPADGRRRRLRARQPRRHAADPARHRTARPGHGSDRAAQLALALYTAYNLAATLASVPAGHAGDRHGAARVLTAGAASFAAANLILALTGPTLAVLAPGFLLAGIGIGCAETAQHAAVATLAPQQLRGSAFGLLAGLQSLGNLAASTIAGVLWTAVSPTAAFLYAATLMTLALPALATAASRGTAPHAPHL